MNATEIGRRLKQARGDSTRKEIAAKAQISVSALAMYERGERIPRDEIKARLAKIYGIPIERLFFYQ